MKPLTLILVLALYSISSLAQDAFSPGYIIDNHGDTVRGNLQNSTQRNLTQQVSFTRKQGASPTGYKPGEIRSFQYEQGDIYRTITFVNTIDGKNQQETLFGHSLVSGKYDLYSIREEGELHFVVKRDTATYFLYTDKVTGNLVTKGNYLNQLNFLSTGCEAVNRKVESTPFTEQSLTAFVQAVDLCLEPGSVQTNYHKPHAKSSIFVFAGGLPLGNDKTQLTFDAALRLAYPRIDPKLSFNVGLHFSNKTEIQHVDATYTLTGFSNAYTSKATHQVISIPVTLQYNILSGFIQPYVYVGFSGAHLHETPPNLFDSDQKFGVAIVGGLGVEVYVTPNFIIKADYRYELLTQYPAIGVACKF
jgi:opacity protein-like surface antigen